MSTALVLDADGRRDKGRWRRGSVAITESGNSGSDWRNRLNEAGIVLDYQRDLALRVVSGDLALDAAFRQAQTAKDLVESAAAREAQEAESEAEARAFIEAKDADLAAKVGGDTIATYREAVAIWEQRNAEEVRLRKQRERDLSESLDRDRDRIIAFLNGWPTAAKLADHPYRDKVLDRLAPHYRQTFLQIESEGFTWTSTD